jgi:hypothetical protein
MLENQSAHQDLGWQFHSPRLLAQQQERPANYANSMTGAGGVASSPASSSGQMTGLTGSYGLIVGPVLYTPIGEEFAEAHSALKSGRWPTYRD